LTKIFRKSKIKLERLKMKAIRIFEK